ncbi:hypothetical protein QN362_10315 [Actimicrobium sp. CCC2.4]|uniref:hypothetical protein n=1 Tax=Actimicrobium sp. CCC2.4 TaxID=3048606 RepID=UPI002AC8ABDD|nr:hypothetical protein [Actimicrobium sp. CCC2.4]MEB0135721.1 hypothetical protein [Actimicrobium sp. CCC2.4]WPX33722.1 hypothetical protein RHM62_07855 [Actimicrobium sp. CCC2.4]
MRFASRGHFPGEATLFRPVFHLMSDGAWAMGIGVVGGGGTGTVGHIARMVVAALRRISGKLGAAGDELLECLVFLYKSRGVLGIYSRRFHGKYSELNKEKKKCIDQGMAMYSCGILRPAIAPERAGIAQAISNCRLASVPKNLSKTDGIFAAVFPLNCQSPALASHAFFGWKASQWHLLLLS